MANMIAVPTPQPPVINNTDDKDINLEVINHVSNMAEIFEKLFSKINVIREATDEKIWRAEETSVAHDIVEMGPFGHLDSACMLGVVTEEDKKNW